MEPSETPRTYQADEENAQAQSGDIRCKAQIKVSDTADKQIPNNKIEDPQSTFTVEEESPSPDGFAKGL